MVVILVFNNYIANVDEVNGYFYLHNLVNDIIKKKLNKKYLNENLLGSTKEKIDFKQIWHLQNFML